jgi:hypothetical protein
MNLEPQLYLRPMMTHRDARGNRRMQPCVAGSNWLHARIDDILSATSVGESPMFIETADASILVQSFGPGPMTIVAHGGWVGSGELWLPVFEELSRS